MATVGSIGLLRTAAVTAVLLALVAEGGGAGASPERGVGGATTVRVSVSSSELQADSDSSFSPAVSADGRFVVFESDATNLVAGDTNGSPDVFVRDRKRGVTRRVSVSSSGQQGDGDSAAPVVSADGRFVVFESDASNLVAGDTNGSNDVFVRDRKRGVTRRVSVSSSGQQAGGGSNPAVSADGRFVAFESFASNLVAGDTNGSNDVFVRDRVRGVTRRVSVSSSGQQADNASFDAAVSADGRFVAFASAASNLVAADTNGSPDVFVRDRKRGVTRRVSVSSSGQQADAASFDAAVSADGRFVVFTSAASNLVSADTNGTFDVFVRDQKRGVTRRVSVSSTGLQADSESFEPAAVSADGRFVAFSSLASNLVAADTNSSYDVFVRDRKRGVTRRVSVRSNGQQGNSESFGSAISADGRYVVFVSVASNLVAADTNDAYDVFARGRL